MIRTDYSAIQKGYKSTFSNPTGEQENTFIAYSVLT